MTRTNERAQFLLDMFTTAIESGITYWADVHAYHWLRPNNTEDAHDFYAIIADDNGDSYRVDADVIAHGLARFRDRRDSIRLISGSDYGAQLIVADRTNGRDGDYDADGADVVVQLGLFGEIRYS